MNNHITGLQPTAELQGLAQGEPWQVQVDVYLDRVHPLKFRVESCLPQQMKKGEKYIQFDNNFRPGFRILFQLHDMTDSGYTFPAKAEDGVWSRVGDECPDETWASDPDYKKYKVFDPERVINSQTTLVVRFENKTQIGDFRYTINVVNDRGDTLHLDPGGTGNNGQSFVSRL